MTLRPPIGSSLTTDGTILFSPILSHHEWEGVALDLDERTRLVSDLGECNFMILWNHGTLAVGDTIASCFLRLYFFEKACRFQVNALAGGAPHLPSDAAMERFNTVESWENLARVAWPALLRRAERLGLEIPGQVALYSKVPIGKR